MKYLLVIVILIICSRLYIVIAKKYNILDIPNNRSSHSKVTIRGGGILFYFSQICLFTEYDFTFWPYLAGLTLLAGVSFLDDILTLRASLRFVIQFISVAILMYFVKIDVHLLVLFIFLVGGVAFINAFNFMDGINGITGIYSIIVLCSFIYVNEFILFFITTELLIYALIALLVFGFYNFRKRALFFAGDVGSVSMAFIFLYISFKFFVSLESPVFIGFFALYGCDTLLTIFKRINLGEKLSDAHRHHTYQKLVDNWGWSHLKVSFAYAVIQLLISIGLLISLNYSLAVQYGTLLLFLIIISILYFYLSLKISKKGF
jgi:UDP-N-acetylmuramyl pentapeptide phosphotransferase/UDP-N-acetylglucosamine-1-phosphate transferase